MPVLLVLLTALVLEGLPVIHAHGDDEPGVYNVVSVVGMLASALFDLPTGATIVSVFGVALLVLWAVSLLGGRGTTKVA